jgi:hypothetical protein
MDETLSRGPGGRGLEADATGGSATVIDAPLQRTGYITLRFSWKNRIGIFLFVRSLAVFFSFKRAASLSEVSKGALREPPWVDPIPGDTNPKAEKQFCAGFQRKSLDSANHCAGWSGWIR